MPGIVKYLRILSPAPEPMKLPLVILAVLTIAVSVPGSAHANPTGEGHVAVCAVALEEGKCIVVDLCAPPQLGDFDSQDWYDYTICEYNDVIIL